MRDSRPALPGLNLKSTEPSAIKLEYQRVLKEATPRKLKNFSAPQPEESCLSDWTSGSLESHSSGLPHGMRSSKLSLSSSGTIDRSLASVGSVKSARSMSHTEVPPRPKLLAQSRSDITPRTIVPLLDDDHEPPPPPYLTKLVHEGLAERNAHTFPATNTGFASPVQFHIANHIQSSEPSQPISSATDTKPKAPRARSNSWFGRRNEDVSLPASGSLTSRTNNNNNSNNSPRSFRSGSPAHSHTHPTTTQIRGNPFQQNTARGSSPSSLLRHGSDQTYHKSNKLKIAVLMSSKSENVIRASPHATLIMRHQVEVVSPSPSNTPFTTTSPRTRKPLSRKSQQLPPPPPPPPQIRSSDWKSDKKASRKSAPFFLGRSAEANTKSENARSDRGLFGYFRKRD
eukprot:c14957_g1_i2.p1 GENE.c14957_g1_i2~~c14957_g1_i2.p1  ORF type:complete len:399 (+),score=43.43 c14957_g1_i2:110-1306(+)